MNNVNRRSSVSTVNNINNKNTNDYMNATSLNENISNNNTIIDTLHDKYSSSMGVDEDGDDLHELKEEILSTVDILPHKEAVLEYSNNYQQIQSLINIVKDVDGSGSNKEVTAEEYNLIMGESKQTIASDFKSLFPTLNTNTNTSGSAPTSPSNKAPVSEGLNLFISILTDPNNKPFHDMLYSYLTNIILDHPLLAYQSENDDASTGSNKNAHTNMVSNIIQVLFEEISEIVSKQIYDVLMATLLEENESMLSEDIQWSHHARNDILVVQYLKSKIMVDETVMRNFMTLAIHSVTGNIYYYYLYGILFYVYI